MKKIFLLSVILVLLGSQACNNKPYDPSIAANPWLIHKAVEKTTEIIVLDIFSPVVAGRIYAYSNIAHYEAVRQGHPEYRSFAGQLHGLTEVPAAPTDGSVDVNLAGLYAYTVVSKAMIFSESVMDDFTAKTFADLKAQGIPDDIFDASIAYGQKVADHILAWAGKDNYAETRSYPKYTINDDLGRWQPTPPAFIEAVEPHWNKIRPMVIDSASQFSPLPNTEFSTDKESLFYKEAVDVYTSVDTDRVERLDIANFWDCNPYIMHQQGHLMVASKKITPGGHWMGIVGLVTRKANLDIVATAETYAMTAIGLFDGFISCWDEKYRSNLVRPETYINRFVDPDWEPALQTPPFPEHTSGHSVISTASSVILTDLLGDNFAFADSTEVPYDLPVRNFNSFYEAAAEACISRFYGGIHYMPSINYGIVQGRNVGEYILAHVDTRTK
jgi:hypothetical protein